MKTFREFILEDNKDREYNAAAAYYANKNKSSLSDEEKIAREKEAKKITSVKIDFNGNKEGKNLLEYAALDSDDKLISFNGPGFNGDNNWTFDLKNKEAENSAPKKYRVTIDFKDIDPKVIKAVETMYAKLEKLYR